MIQVPPTTSSQVFARLMDMELVIVSPRQLLFERTVPPQEDLGVCPECYD